MTDEWCGNGRPGGESLGGRDICVSSRICCGVIGALRYFVGCPIGRRPAFRPTPDALDIDR